MSGSAAPAPGTIAAALQAAADAVAANAAQYGAMAGNVVTRENALVLASGAALNPNDATEAAASASVGIDFGLLTPVGSVNHLSATVPGGVVFPALRNKMRFPCSVAATNTGAVQVDLHGFGATVLTVQLNRRDGTPLQSGDLPLYPFEVKSDAAGNLRMAGAVASDGTSGGLVTSMPGLIGGRVPSIPTGTATTATITFTPGGCTDSTGQYFHAGTSPLVWTVPNGQSLPVSETVHVHEVWQASVLNGPSTAAFTTGLTTAPTLAAGYVSKLLFSFITDGTGAPVSIKAIRPLAGGALDILFTNYFKDLSYQPVSTSDLTFSVRVPRGIPVIWRGKAAIIAPGATANWANQLNVEVYGPDETKPVLPGPTAYLGDPIPDEWHYLASSTTGYPGTAIANRDRWTGIAAQLCVIANQNATGVCLNTYGYLQHRT